MNMDCVHTTTQNICHMCQLIIYLKNRNIIIEKGTRDTEKFVLISNNTTDYVSIV